MFGQTVTLYHRIEQGGSAEVSERWARFVLHGVFFTSTTGERVSQKGSRSDAGGMLLIPFAAHAQDYHPPGEYAGEGWTVDKGDVVAEGALDYEIRRSTSELRSFGAVSTVTAIRRLPFGGLAHWKIWCDGSQY